MNDFFAPDMSEAQVDSNYEQQIKDHNAQVAVEQEEEKKAQQLEQQQKIEVQKQEAEDAKAREYEGAGGFVKLAGETAASTLLGVGDFVSDVAGTLPLTKPIDNWWDENSPRFSHPLTSAVRDASAVIIPTLVIGNKVQKGGKLLTQGMNISKNARLAGSIAAAAGVDAGVTAISSTSERDDNVAGTLNKWLGWDIPWGTRDSDSPDVRKKKNIYDAAGFSVGVDLLSAVFALRKGLKIIPKDEVSKASMDIDAKKLDNTLDPASAEVTRSRTAREVEVSEEGLRALDENPTEYNAFINEPAEAQARGVLNVDPNAIHAKADHARIQMNEGTLNGRARPAVTNYFMDKFMKAVDGSTRKAHLDEAFGTVKPSVDAVVDGVRISAKQIDQAVDNLVNAVLKPDGGIDEFAKTVEGMKKNVYNEVMLLDEENALIAATAFREAFDQVFDPNAMRASAMITQNAADNVADASTAAMWLDGLADTSRQQELAFDKLKLLAREVRINQAISGMALNYKKFIKAGKKDEAVAYLSNAPERLNEVLQEASIKGNNLVDEIKAIREQNPEYWSPFMKAFDATNGDVDTLHKLHQYAQNRIGILKKAFVDGNPEIPSSILQELSAVRYNSILFGLAPVRAAFGNAMLLVSKPVSILAGGLASRDSEVMKRALYTFGGISESFKRGIKLMGDEWRLANSNPEGIMTRGRADLAQSRLDDLELMDSMADGWKADGQLGKYAIWNITKGLSWYNNNPFNRLGINAMYAVDGFTKAFTTSMVMRAKAYDELYTAGKGVIDEAQFAARQQQLYSEAFGPDNLITDKAATFAASEISLNLDSKIVDDFNHFLNRVPAAKSLFMFPRTGINALELGWSFNPLSSIGLAAGRAKKVLKASTNDEIMEVLAEHGIDYTSTGADIAFRALKSEYVGRQIMGSTIVTVAGLWALEGNLTGNGPVNDAERRRMINLGWQPNSFKDPITGEWRSYKGLEPFDTLLGLVADFTYEANRVDSSIAEGWWQKLSFSISMNVANKTFLSGFEPLVSMLSGDASAVTRFTAGMVNTTLPVAGARSLLSQAITPQLKDVENDFMSWMKNYNKYLYNGNDDLKDLVDIYTGEPIKFHDPLTAAFNAMLPTFKTNGGMEPWRQWLIKTGWDGLQTQRMNRNKQQPLTTTERQWINNWIAANMDLKGSIQKMMNRPDAYWDKKIREYTKARGMQSQSEFPIKQLVVHQMLNKIHDDAFEAAFSAMEQSDAMGTHISGLTKQRNNYLRSGEVSKAKEKADQLKNLLDMQPK